MNWLGDDDETIKDDKSNDRHDNGMPFHVDNEPGYYNEGLENGVSGSSSEKGLFGDFIPPSEAESEARERGYEAGKQIYEANQSKDDD